MAAADTEMPQDFPNKGYIMAELDELINDPAVTMIRLMVPDEAKSCGTTVIASARLEGNGRYNVRSNRKVILRNLPKTQIKVFMNGALAKYPNGYLIGYNRPVYTKSKVTVADIFAAINNQKE